MARIALIKVFAGLNLGIAQLAGELLRAGHETHIFLFKEFLVRKPDEVEGLEGGEELLLMNGQRRVWMLNRPFTPTEYGLLVDQLKAFRPDAIGMNVVALTVKQNIAVAQELRKHFDVPIIWGGTAPTLEPEKCIPHTDLICINEGEEVIVELARRLDAGEPITDIAGTWHRQGDTITRNPKRELLDLDSIAMPCWEKKRFSFIDDNELKTPTLPKGLRAEYPIMTQRGCPFSCSFCIESRYQEMFGKKGSLRRRKPELVLEELRWAKKHLQIRKVLFYDDVFTVHPRWLKEFLPRYKEEIGLPFWCYTYPTTHDPEMLKLLTDHGCISVGMGIQTGSQRLLKEHYNRPTERARIIEACQEIADAGIEGVFDLITRGPFDTEADLRETFELLMEIPQELTCMGFGNMSLLPSFSLTRQAEDAGLVDKGVLNYRFPLPQGLYDYYHKLYLLTRTKIDKDLLKSLADDPRIHEDHELLNPYLTEYLGSHDFQGRSWMK